MIKENIFYDVYKGKINTFVTLRYIPTDITIARSIPTKSYCNTKLKVWMNELKIKAKNATRKHI